MATVNDSMQAAAAAWEIDQRFLYHTATGEMLDGLNYDSEGTLKVDGEDDLPLVQPWAILTDEDLSPGIPSSGNRDTERKNQPVAETATFIYRVAASRTNLWFRRDPTDATASKGFLEWLCLIRDAIETPAFPTNITLTGSNTPAFNDDYIFNPSNKRWEKDGDTSYYVYYTPIPEVMNIYGLGDIQYIKSGTSSVAATNVVGHYTDDGSLGDTDGMDVAKGASQTIQPDAALQNAAYKPVKFRIRETDTTQLAYHCFLEVEIYLHHYCRSSRSDDLPTL